MRRIYYRFPTSYDLDFDLPRPFGEVLRCLHTLHDSHSTYRREKELVKRQILVQLATNRMNFEMLDALPPFEDTVTETADLRLILHDTILSGQGRFPLSENIFLLRVEDKGQHCECMVVREGDQGSLDATTVRDLLKGACP